MSPHQRAQKKAKLWQRASDYRGNEHERRLAEQSYRKMCEADGGIESQRTQSGFGPGTGERPEFNRFERTLIKVGAAVLVGAAVFVEVLKARRKAGRRQVPRAAAR